MDEIVLLEWTIHLLRQQPRRAPVVALAVIAAGGLGGFLFHSLLFALLGATLIVSAAAEYLFPIRYRLTSRRACAFYGIARLEMEWDRVRRVESAAGMLKLSPFSLPNRLDGMRGILLRYPECMRTAVTELADRHSACAVSPERSPESSNE